MPATPELGKEKVDSVHEPIIKSRLVESAKGEKIGLLTLNKPKALNALNLDMVHELQRQLIAWEMDASVKIIVLAGEGNKAFCAGGDVVSMFTSMKNERDKLAKTGKLDKAPDFLEAFFTYEYELDYHIANYTKPIVCWGNGIVMGGGLGLFAASEFAVVTESSRIAMPEITIGLFPDVGGSYFLNQMPPGVGLFLGQTGASFNAQDALDIGLASHSIDHECFEFFIQQLSDMKSLNRDTLSSLLNDLQHKSTAVLNLAPQVAPLLADLKPLAECTSSQPLAVGLKKLSELHPNNQWLNKAIATWERGSPITSALVIEQLNRAKNMSLADVFRQEINMAVSCGLYGEFQEGVRALLIDKDRKPKWLYSAQEGVPMELIDAHFTYYTSDNNPLRALGENPHR